MIGYSYVRNEGNIRSKIEESKRCRNDEIIREQRRRKENKRGKYYDGDIRLSLVS
jgi:hypothetical protein